jgi:hypothetical protein
MHRALFVLFRGCIVMHPTVPSNMPLLYRGVSRRTQVHRAMCVIFRSCILVFPGASKCSARYARKSGVASRRIKEARGKGQLHRDVS